MNKTALIALILTLMTACSGARLQDNETETFTPRIVDDGSKRFEYQLATPSGRAQKPRLVFDANEPTDMNEPPDMTTYSAEEEKQHIEARVLTLLDRKLETTGYCRQGYVVLRKTIGFSQSVVTGECKETATEADRRQFQP